MLIPKKALCTKMLCIFGILKIFDFHDFSVSFNSSISSFFSISSISLLLFPVSSQISFISIQPPPQFAKSLLMEIFFICSKVIVSMNFEYSSFSISFSINLLNFLCIFITPSYLFQVYQKIFQTIQAAK